MAFRDHCVFCFADVPPAHRLSAAVPLSYSDSDRRSPLASVESGGPCCARSIWSTNFDDHWQVPGGATVDPTLDDDGVLDCALRPMEVSCRRKEGSFWKDTRVFAKVISGYYISEDVGPGYTTRLHSSGRQNDSVFY